MNSVILVGRAVRDPELINTNNGTAVCKFNIAVDRPTKQGEEKTTDFLSIVTFGKQAENCHKYLTKGRQCAVSGSIQTRSYDAKDGTKRYVTEIISDKVEFLGGNSGNNEQKPAPKQPSEVTAIFEPLSESELPF